MHLRLVCVELSPILHFWLKRCDGFVWLPVNDPDHSLLGCLSELSIRAVKCPVQRGNVYHMMLVAVAASHVQDGIMSKGCRLPTGIFVGMFPEDHLRCRASFCLMFILSLNLGTGFIGCMRGVRNQWQHFVWVSVQKMWTRWTRQWVKARV